MLEKLTKEQEALMLQVRDEWVNLALNECHKGINKPAFETGIKWLYNDLLKKPTPKIIYCDSWLSCILTIAILKKLSNKQNIKIGASVGGAVRDSVEASVEASVRASVGASVRASVGDSVRDSVRDSVGDAVWDAVRDSVGASVWDAVGASVGGAVRASVGGAVRASVWDAVWDSFIESSIYVGVSNYGWVSFYDFFERINMLDNFKFKEYKKLIKSNCFQAYEYENFVFAVQPPAYVKIDSKGQMHSVEIPAIKFKDGYAINYIHGVEISKTIWDKLQSKSYTFDDFIKEDNQEVKSAILSFFEEKYGGEYLFRFISENLKEVDTYMDRKTKEYLVGTTEGMNIGVYTLFKGVVNNINLAFVRCYCPSTDRMFFLPVKPDNKNAKDAIASLYRIPKKLKQHIKYINRQGERYSTVLTEEGNELLSKMSKSEIEDLTDVSGDFYFSTIKYEY